MYVDAEIGLGFNQIFDKCLIESSNDDDVNSDDDVLEAARNNCINDINRSFKSLIKD